MLGPFSKHIVAPHLDSHIVARKDYFLPAWQLRLNIVCTVRNGSASQVRKRLAHKKYCSLSVTVLGRLHVCNHSRVRHPI
jgi:hypothetical protein